MIYRLYNISGSKLPDWKYVYFRVNGSTTTYTIVISFLDDGSYTAGGTMQLYVNSNFNPALQKIDSNSSFVPPSSESPLPDSYLSVDTKTIDVPEEIPDDAQGSSNLGGLLFPAIGAGLGGAAGAIASSIIDGVFDGVIPDIDIRPADVNIPPNMEIDDDGNIFPSDLDIRPTDIFLDSDSYKLDSLNNYFPFSIPWDMMIFASMFRAEPEIPVVDFLFPMPDGIDDFHIIVDLTPYDSVATLLREGFFVLFAIRWLLFLYRKFG